MAFMAPVSGFLPAALERFSAGLPLPEAAASSAKQPKQPDVVVFSSAPTRILSDLASAGLRQLATLLPMLERAVVQSDNMVPLAQLAKAAGAAARQIGDGHEALLAEGPDRVASSMQQAPAPASTASDTKQLLRTFVRQIGGQDEPIEASRAEAPDRPPQSPTLARSVTAPELPTDTKQALRTLARQIGGQDEPIEASRAQAPDRPPQAPTLARSATAPEVATETNQALRTLARQIGAEIEPSRTLVEAADQPQSRVRAEPDAGPLQTWISEARHLLRSTGDVLERAEEQLRPLAAAQPGTVGGALPTAWVLTEILAAQAQIALAYAAVGRARPTARVNYRTTPHAMSLDHIASATTLLGMLLVLATLWVLGGLWSAATGTVALCGVAMWVWRISQASKGVTLDARR